LEYGDTKQHVEKYMLGLAGIQDVREYGPMFTEMVHGIATGKISDPRQLLQMFDSGAITIAGMKQGQEALNQANKPEGRWVNAQVNVAVQQMKNTVFRGVDENTEGSKPSVQQQMKLTDVLRTFYDGLSAPDVDMKKYLSKESIDALVEGVYPRYERDYDFINRGQPFTKDGVTYPPNLTGGEDAQKKYAMVIGSPWQTGTKKDGTPATVTPGDWQRAINILISNPNNQTDKEHFRKLFPGADPDYYIKLLPTDPTIKLPPTVAAGERGFLSNLFWLGLPNPEQAKK
jgi:hypothetical protein